MENVNLFAQGPGRPMTLAEGIKFIDERARSRLKGKRARPTQSAALDEIVEASSVGCSLPQESNARASVAPGDLSSVEPVRRNLRRRRGVTSIQEDTSVQASVALESTREEVTVRKTCTTRRCSKCVKAKAKCEAIEKGGCKRCLQYGHACELGVEVQPVEQEMVKQPESPFEFEIACTAEVARTLESSNSAGEEARSGAPVDRASTETDDWVHMQIPSKRYLKRETERGPIFHPKAGIIKIFIHSYMTGFDFRRVCTSGR